MPICSLIVFTSFYILASIDAHLLNNEIAIESELCDVQLSSDKDVVVAVARNGEIEVKPYIENETIPPIIVRHDQAINSLNFSLKKDIFITTSDDNMISLWRLNRERNTFDVELWTTLAGQCGEITAITFSDDGKFFASASADGTIRLWHLEDFQSIFSLPVDGGVAYSDLVEHSACEPTNPDVKIYALKFYQEDKIIAAINQLGNIMFWSIDENIRHSIKALKELALYKYVEAAAFSANGHQLAMVTRKNDSFYSERRIQTYNLHLDKLIETAGKRIQNYIGVDG